MLPFLNARLFRNNFLALQPFIEKMKSGQLTLENILEEDEIIQDLKTNQNSQFLGMISSEAIRKLIDYATKIPASDDKNIGHKYPFNATELLCCDNAPIVERFMNEIKVQDEDDEDEEEEEKDGENEGDKKDENEEQKEENKDEDKSEQKLEQNQEEKVENQPENKEEPKEEPKPEVKEEPKPEVKEEPKPEAKEEPKPEVKEEPKPEAKEEPKPEAKEEPKPEVKEEPKPEVKEEPKPEVKEEPKPEVKEEPKPEAKEEPKPEVKEEPKPEVKEEPKPEAKEEPKPEAKEEPKPESKEEPKAEEENKEEENEAEDDKSKSEGEDSEKEEGKKLKYVLYNNVDYLLEFLKSSEETKSNYVLVGYFYKILNHLFSSQSSKIVLYIYDYPKKDELDILELLVKNMNRKSMGEIINKLLLFQEETDESFIQKKMDLFKRVLEELKNSKEEDKFECICSTLESTIYNKTFFFDFMKDPQYYKTLITILDESKDIPKKLIAVMKLLIKINESILKNIEGRLTPSLFQENPMDIINMFSSAYPVEEDNTKEVKVDLNPNIKDLYKTLFECLEKDQFNFIEDICDFSREENKEFTTTYQKEQKRIGLKKLAQVELFRSILDMLVNGYVKYEFKEEVEKIMKIIADKNLFWEITQIFLDYPFSSMYQTIFNQIMNISLINESPEFLIKYVLMPKKGNEQKNLLDIFMDKIKNDMVFTYTSKRKSFNPNFSFEITILSKIFLSENPSIKELIKDNKNLVIFDEVIGDEVKKLFDQKLLLSENDIQIGGAQEKEEKKPEGYYKKKNFMESLDEDISIFNMYLKGEDYKTALNAKKEREEKEKEEKEERELEEEKKKNEEDQMFVQEGENEIENESDGKNKFQNLKGSINIGQDDGEEEDNNNINVEESNEKAGNIEKDEKEEETEEEEKEEDKKYNDVNFWKMESVPEDSIMSSILNDLD